MGVERKEADGEEETGRVFLKGSEFSLRAGRSILGI